MKSPIYLDYHATTPVDPQVLEAMLPYFYEKFGNAASRNHSYGWTAEAAVETARGQVAQLLGAADKSEIIFTSGATESNNLAITGAVAGTGLKNCHIITAATEHKSVLDCCRFLETQGHRVTVLPVDRYGCISMAALSEAITPQTVLISIMWANNEIGTLQPLAEIGQLAQERGILFHTDAVQAIGYLPFNAEAAGTALVSTSGHKIYGPKGVGALYVRRKGPRVSLSPQSFGGGQERGLRSGTLNVPGIVGLGKAAELALQTGLSETQRLQSLRDRMFQELTAALGGVVLNGHPTQRLPHNLNLSFEGVRGEALLAGLKGLAVSSGSACLAETDTASHVLQAIELPEPLIRSSVRFGLGRYTTGDEMKFAAQTVIDTVSKLRTRRGA